MAQAHKCDLCKQLYEGQYVGTIRAYGPSSESHTSWKPPNGTIGGELCRSCWGEVLNFFKNIPIQKDDD